MKLVAASQRVDWLADRNEGRDALDQRWAELCGALGMGLVPVPNRLNSPDAWLDCIRPSAIVLTGGNDVALVADAGTACPDRDRTEERLLAWAIRGAIPVLAVCRGFQFVNVYFGGRVSRLPGHVCVTHGLDWADAMEGLSEVNSFHSFGITASDLAADLLTLATAHDGSVEAARHKSLPIMGVMWHPERSPPTWQPALDFCRRHLSGK